MLVFFIHGVAESKVKFAEPLKTLIQKEFSQKGKILPHFHSGFYADLLNNKGKIWNFIYQDIEKVKRENPHINQEDILRGQELRQGFISDFIGDAFTYLNHARGGKIRQSITEHLEDLIKNHPEEEELHIVAHSMGTVILWDMLFSDQFQFGDAAFNFRSLIDEQVKLKTITTMGSPVILFNMLLDIQPEQVKLRKTADDMDRYNILLDHNSRGILTEVERLELISFRHEADLFMLRKAQAAVLLNWRGYRLSNS